MKKVLYLALALFLVGCVEPEAIVPVPVCEPKEEEPQVEEPTKEDLPMRISESFPIKFFPFYGETYNEMKIEGVQKMCYFQPALCFGSIFFQVADVDPDQPVWLKALDEDGVELAEYEMENFGGNYAGLALAPNNEGWCNQKVSFQYRSAVTGNTSQPDLDNVSTQKDYLSGVAWTAGVDEALVTMSSTYSDIVYWPVAAGMFNLDFGIEALSSGTTVRFFAVGLDIGLNVVFEEELIDLESGSAVGSPEFTFPVDMLYLGIRAQVISGSGGTKQFRVYQYELPTGRVYQKLFRSDLIEFKDDLTGLDIVAIQYNDVKPYDNLSYVLPNNAAYTLLIDGQFWKDRFVEDDVTHDLSDGTMISTSSEMYTERQLMVNLAPMYVHRQILGALKHSNVYVGPYGGVVRVTKRDKYTMDDSPNPTKLEPQSATCWLVLYNSITRNVL